MPASLVSFSLFTPTFSEAGEGVFDGGVNVAPKPTITLFTRPELGLGVDVNGGALTEAARPLIEPMVDAEGRVLPQYARLFRVDPNTREEISGTDVALTVRLRTTSFRNGLPAERVFFWLEFTAAEPLLEFTLYDFSYVNALPAEWQARQRLIYVAPGSGSGSAATGLGGSF
jgi:hypothetical protein